MEKYGSLSGRIALVTGASSGLGRAIAVALSQEGANVCAIGRNPTTLAETVAAAQKHSQAIGFQFDLASEQSFEELLRHLERAGRRRHSGSLCRNHLSRCNGKGPCPRFRFAIFHQRPRALRINATPAASAYDSSWPDRFHQFECRLGSSAARYRSIRGHETRFKSNRR